MWCGFRLVLPLVGVGRSGLSLATILIPLLLKRRAADCDTMPVVCASLSPYGGNAYRNRTCCWRKEGRSGEWMDPACRDVCNLLCVADVQQGCIVCDEFDRLTHVAKTKRRRRGRSATCTSFSRIWTDKSFFPLHEQRLFALIWATLWSRSPSPRILLIIIITIVGYIPRGIPRRFFSPPFYFGKKETAKIIFGQIYCRVVVLCPARRCWICWTTKSTIPLS